MVGQLGCDMRCDWTVEQLLSPSLCYLFFLSVRLKMAARDGDMPVWPAKHWARQIPLFIHKLDPLGLRGRFAPSADMRDLCVWVELAKEYVCIHRGVSECKLCAR